MTQQRPVDQDFVTVEFHDHTQTRKDCMEVSHQFRSHAILVSKIKLPVVFLKAD